MEEIKKEINKLLRQIRALVSKIASKSPWDEEDKLKLAALGQIVKILETLGAMKIANEGEQISPEIEQEIIDDFVERYINEKQNKFQNNTA